MVIKYGLQDTRINKRWHLASVLQQLEGIEAACGLHRWALRQNKVDVLRIFITWFFMLPVLLYSTAFANGEF